MGSLFILFIFLFVVLLYICLILGIYAVAIASYVLKALSLQKIGTKLGISKSGLAWIPYVDSFVLGSIVDRIESERGESDKKWRKILLTVIIIGAGGNLVLSAIYYVLYFAQMIFTSAVSAYDHETYMTVTMILSILMLLLSFMTIIPMICMSLYSVLYTVCVYRVYEHIAPSKAIIYIIVSLLIPLGMPICLLLMSRALAAQVDEGESVSEEGGDIAETI